MKNLFAILTISILSFAGNAQAADSHAAYIMQKRAEAFQVKRSSEVLVQKLRSLPQDEVYMVNTTPKVAGASAAAIALPSPEEFEAIATAAGGSGKNLVASQKQIFK